MTNLDMDNPLTFSGSTINHTASCWMVKSSDAASLAVYYQPFLSNASKVWLALR
jgi:hypothetical protein